MPSPTHPDPGSGKVPAEVLLITPECRIARDELVWRFMPSGGPGGQHANRSRTRAELRFDIATSPSLNPEQREILLERIGGQLRVTCDRERSQARNRAIAVERLVARLKEALRPETPRKATRTPRSAHERRLDEKRRLSQMKRSRGWKPEE